MLATRIIPTLLARGRELVKGQGFDSHRRVGNVLSAARIHNMREVDELCILNVGSEKWNLDDVQTICSDCFMPVSIGGGIETLEDIRLLLGAGADKVVIRRKELVTPASEKFGAQAVVFCINHRGDLQDSVNEAREAEFQGAGEILLQSVQRDGTMKGYDQDLIREVCSRTTIPVVASGGCLDYDDMAEAINNGAHAVAVGALFQFCDATPEAAAKHLRERGFVVRVAA